MKYLLILTLINGGITVVPDSYPDRNTCETVGGNWQQRINGDGLFKHASYLCVVKFKDE
jgi:hypothetical protein